MKHVLICIVGSLAVLQLATPALALTEFTYVKAGAVETARDFTISILNLQRIASEEDSLGNTDPKEVLANPDSLAQGDTFASATAYASAEIGHLGVSITGIAQGAAKNRPGTVSLGGAATASASATAEWVDLITLSSRGHTALRAVFNVFMEGNVGAHATGGASGLAQFRLSNGQDSRFVIPDAPYLSPSSGVWGFAREIPQNNIHELDQIPGAFRVELFPPSELFPIGFSIELTGQANSSISNNQVDWDDDTGSFFGEVSRSLRWGGVEAVYDFFTGEEIDDWTITSASGFDYSKPFGVPEPSTLWTLLTGILTMCCRRRSQVS
jgi:hypothetical protein